MTLDNSKWPNGIKEDAEGSAIFYPLGTNKTNITDVNWPEGHKLISPFVYDENDKLIDFIDTKAIVVTGNDTTTTIPYNHIEADFSSILEGALNIDAPNASTKVVKWNRYPADLLPGDYTHVGYLESTGTQTIKMNGLYDKRTGLRLEAETFEGTGNVSCVYFLTQNPSAEKYWWVFPPRANRDNHSLWEWYWFKTFGSFKGLQLATRYVATINYRSEKKVTIEQNGTIAAKELPEPLDYSSTELNVISSGWKGRCYSVYVSRNTELENIFIPALDPTGAPCLFDAVSRETFYNAGTGDFMTSLTNDATTYGMRRVLPDWGKLTPNGLRRLYHAPAGYKGDTYDYAIENGYKQIVEPEMPEEGYWRPEWTETDTQIICNWIETEAPAEENT